VRVRNIKPGLYKDDELAALPIEARYLLPGLWLLADVKGRLEDRPRWIKSEIYPYDDQILASRVDELLNLLQEACFIRRYEVDGNRYIQVVNFEKDQHPHKNEVTRGSHIPAPAELGPTTIQPDASPGDDEPRPGLQLI
jgi:hypothetical protein